VILCGAYPKGKKATMWTRIMDSHIFMVMLFLGKNTINFGWIEFLSIGSYSGILPGNTK
jgi:hypothetical protein